MTTLAMPERWTFGGVDLSSYAIRLSALNDIDTLPDLRGEDVAIPQRIGRYPVGKQFDGRRQGLALWIGHQPADGVEVVAPAAQARANLDALVRVLSRRSRQALTRYMPDGTTRTAMAEVVSMQVPDYPVANEAMPLVVDFYLADPWYYGAQVSPVQAIAASPTDFIVTNAGSVDAGRLVIDFLGPLSNPRLANLTIDPSGAYYVEGLVTVPAATHLIIDVALATALNNAVNAIGSIRHSGGVEFFRLVPGANSLRATTGTLGGSVTITYSPPYA